MDTGIIRTNIFYGSLTPEITKVVSVHGTVDPWHALGILEDLNPLAPAILINGKIKHILTFVILILLTF